ncbi:MAG: hypothetical protein JO152_10195 [Mycobacteriaceae bacterium]|nr:hypothetical protein [Mycobacteriaceae bacterium]
MSLFLFRLLPPRPDFAQTLAPAEQQAMAHHQDYWQKLLADRRVVVYGPVADPEGVWGMGVVRADSQEDVILLGQNDPAIASGVCTFDVMEIMGGRTG